MNFPGLKINFLRFICAIQQLKIVPLRAVARMQEKEEVDHPMDQSFQVPKFLLKSHSDLTGVETKI